MRFDVSSVAISAIDLLSAPAVAKSINVSKMTTAIAFGVVAGHVVIKMVDVRS